MDRWGLLWRSNNRLDGKRQHIMWDKGQPLIFPTRQKAREYRDEYYGYIREREDLRREPHGWKMPLPVKVEIIIKEQSNDTNKEE